MVELEIEFDFFRVCVCIPYALDISSAIVLVRESIHRRATTLRVGTGFNLWFPLSEYTCVTQVCFKIPLTNSGAELWEIKCDLGRTSFGAPVYLKQRVPMYMNQGSMNIIMEFEVYPVDCWIFMVDV